MPNVVDNESLYNVIVLDGMSSPGIVHLSGHDRIVKWDVQTGPFMGGARTVFMGIPPIEFTATFYLVKDAGQNIDDFAAWPAFQAKIDSTTNGASGGFGFGFGNTGIKALSIYHPDLASQKPPIASVVKSSVGGFVYDDMGGATVVVKFQEYRPPRIMGASVLGSKGTAPDPNADVKAQLQNLTLQYQNTPTG